MMNLLAQATDLNFWRSEHNSFDLWLKLFIALALGIAMIFGLMAAPSRLRRPIVAAATFLAGLYWVALYFWPVPLDRDPGEMPRNVVEGVGFWLEDANGVIVSFTQILTAFLLGLGIFSLLRVHLTRISRRQTDWGFSIVLLASMIIMVIFGYADWMQRLGERGSILDNPANWGLMNFGRDFLFEGLLQQMDAAMFSIIAFYILSAAYRAFRIRSIEATILLSTALLVMLSLMGAVAFVWDESVKGVANGNPFLLNFQLSEISAWIRNTFQTASLRGIAFGVGIGALAMGVRLWLSLERTGGNG